MATRFYRESLLVWQRLYGWSQQSTKGWTCRRRRRRRCLIFCGADIFFLPDFIMLLQKEVFVFESLTTLNHYPINISICKLLFLLLFLRVLANRDLREMFYVLMAWKFSTRDNLLLCPLCLRKWCET